MSPIQLARKRGARTLKRSKKSGKIGKNDWITALLRSNPRMALRFIGGEEQIPDALQEEETIEQDTVPAVSEPTEGEGKGEESETPGETQ